MKTVNDMARMAAGMSLMVASASDATLLLSDDHGKEPAQPRKRKPSGKDRSKVKAGRKQRRKQK